MIIAFENKELRKICEDDNTANAELGYTIAEVLMNRLADIQAARNPTELPVGKPSEFEEHGIAKFKVELIERYRLIFEPNHPDEGSYMNEGKINWSMVTRVKILKIQQNDEQ